MITCFWQQWFCHWASCGSSFKWRSVTQEKQQQHIKYMLGSKKSYVTADHTRAHSKDSLPHNAARCTRPYPKPLITRKKTPHTNVLFINWFWWNWIILDNISSKQRGYVSSKSVWISLLAGWSLTAAWVHVSILYFTCRSSGGKHILCCLVFVIHYYLLPSKAVVDRPPYLSFFPMWRFPSVLVLLACSPATWTVSNT